MSSLVPPRYELPIIDKNGQMSREWYKFLVQMAKAVGPSLTSVEDVQIFAATDNGEVVALQALQQVQSLQRGNDGLMWLPDDRPVPADTSLLAWWPGDTK